METSMLVGVWVGIIDIGRTRRDSRSRQRGGNGRYGQSIFRRKIGRRHYFMV